MIRRAIFGARSSLRHLRRSTRGSIYLETAAAVFLMFFFVLGLTRFMLYSNDIGVAERTLRSATDLAWQVEQERPNSLTQAQLDDMRRSLERVYGPSGPGRVELIMSYYDANDTGSHYLTFSGTSGGLGETSRVGVSPSHVMLGTHSYVLADDERLLVIELFVRGRGLQKDRIDYYSTAVMRGGASTL